MTPSIPPPTLHAHGRRAALLLAVALGLAAAAAFGQAPSEGTAAALQARREQLQPALHASPFGEPLVLRTREGADRIEGDVWAEVAHPFPAVAAMLRSPAGLCELLFLHLNVRGCTPQVGPEGTVLALLVGPKRSGRFDSEYRMRYTMRSEGTDAGHVRVTLAAATGPLSTRDYRIVFEAVPIDTGRSFVHLGYAYGYGAVAKMTMGAYLVTAGRAKVGFTSEGTEPDGSPKHVRGERAALERNVMRYYLALLAGLAPAPDPPAQRLQARLRDWFARTEKYAEQLHEYGLDEYLKEKNEQLARGRLGR